MINIANLLTEHIDIWTAADTEKKSGRGRASGNGGVYGVKKLRELILELAVRGKLVPQDPNDEPASELLKRIQAEKTKLIAEGKLKKEKPLAPIGEDEEPFKVPIGWKWVRLSEIAEANTGYAFKSNEYTSEGTFVLRVTNINPDTSINPEDAKFISTDSANSEYKNFQLTEGDVLLVMVGGSLGKIGVVDKSCLPAVLNQNMWKLSNFGKIEKKYFIDGLRFINRSQIVITESTHGHLAQGEYLSKLFPLPPLPEQQRIVTKVDELMALCDQLEQQHSNAQEAHETLVSQLLATLTQSQNAAEFNANWQRIYAHFDVLFTTEASIDALKQTLLQLAVMGKLVPQDPNDEPASELLKRIQAEKAKLITEGKLKKEKPLTPIGEDEKPFELPKGWDWVRVSQLFNVISGGSFEVSQEKETGEYMYIKVADMNLEENSVDIVTSSRYINPTEKQMNGLIPPNSIIFPKRGGAIATNKKRLIKTHTFVDLNIMAITVPSSVALQYVYQWLNGIDLAKLNTGTSVPQINHQDIDPLVFPLPPIAEQHRIVAKVDALMALCDQLKTLIQQANQQQQAIADVLVAQALRPHKAEVIDLAEYRKSLTCYVINAQHSNSTFGRTQAEKVLAFSQNHIGFNTELQFRRKMAGPYSGWMEVFEAEAKEKGWISVRTKQISDTKYKYEYGVNSTLTKQTIYFENNCPAQQKHELDRLLKLFENLNTEQAEIIATLFCAWNDFLINGDLPTDDEVIREVRESWHPSKERFLPEQLTKWLNWLRENNIVPTGKGSKTIKIGHQQKLIN